MPLYFFLNFLEMVGAKLRTVAQSKTQRFLLRAAAAINAEVLAPVDFFQSAALPTELPG